MFYDRLRKRLETILSTYHQDTPQKERVESYLKQLADAKIILLNADQANVFMHSTYPLENYPHLIFPKIFINFTEPLKLNAGLEFVVEGGEFKPLGGREVNIPGVLVRQFDAYKIKQGFDLDTILKKGIVDPTMVDKSALLMGCLSIWYESFPRRDEELRVGDLTVSFTTESFPEISGEMIHQKYNTINRAKLLNKVTINLLYFLSCENIELIYRDKKSSREFMKSIGQNTRYPFYTVHFKRGGERVRPASTETGTKHSFRYDVRGHFRHLRDDRYKRNSDGTYKVIWIPAHQRGLANELYLPALRDASSLPAH